MVLGWSVGSRSARRGSLLLGTKMLVHFAGCRGPPLCASLLMRRRGFCYTRALGCLVESVAFSALGAWVTAIPFRSASLVVRWTYSYSGTVP